MIAGGLARVAGARLRLRQGHIREPDVMYLTGEHRSHVHEEYWTHADLVVEVLSPGVTNVVRDRVTRRQEYAAAMIPEYWIVDPDAEEIVVLTLGPEGYEERGAYGRGTTVSSPTLVGFVVDVSEVFDAE